MRSRMRLELSICKSCSACSCSPISTRSWPLEYCELSRAFEMELVLAGNMITVDLNFGVINQGREKNQEPKRALSITMNNGFLHL